MSTNISTKQVCQTAPMFIYALHQICSDSKAPIKIINDIYNAYPSASLVKIDGKHTPISVAVDAGFEEAVWFLAKICPEACTISNNLGSAPIFSAVYKISYSNIIDILLNANPIAAFIKRPDGYSAFDAFFQVWNVFVRISLYDQITIDQVHKYFVGAGNWAILDIYHKASLLLKAANLYHRSVINDHYLLHCALREESCHGSFCILLMIMYPEQILIKDEDGNLPNHIITAAKDKSDEETFLCVDCFSKKSKLVNIEYKNDDTEYCCEDCFEFKSWDLVSKKFYISPGKNDCFLFSSLRIFSFPLTIFSPKSTWNCSRVGNICTTDGFDPR